MADDYAKPKEVFNERISMALVMALRGATDGECLAGLHAMRRIIEAQSLSADDAKVFFAQGEPGHWMSSILRLVKFAEEQRDEAVSSMKRYRTRLAELETAFLAVKRIFRPIAPRDPKDFRLEHEVRMTQPPIDEVNPDELFGSL